MRLLLAEDERSLSRALVTILNRNGFEADAVYDGKAALEAIESGNYDGAVLDIMMPKMNGLEVLKTIRDKKNLIPILMLTAKAEIDDKVEGLDLGANDYLTKPFAAKELLARIRTMIRTQTTQTESILHVGNITLNRATFELTSPTGSFRLANKEFQMMEMLMSHPGSVISADQFMERIWGYDSEAEINIVWTYLSYLRKKITALEAPVQIRAIRGAGYRLEATKKNA